MQAVQRPHCSNLAAHQRSLQLSISSAQCLQSHSSMPMVRRQPARVPTPLSDRRRQNGGPKDVPQCQAASVRR